MDRQILCEQIEKLGGTCELTENGPDALELFSSSDEGRFDGFFIGSKMLGMNGFELAKEVRYSALPDGYHDGGGSYCGDGTAVGGSGQIPSDRI